MELDLYTQSLLWAFGLSLVFGGIANKANFCTMGAVSDWINMGDLNRMRSWMLAVVTAILGVGILEYTGSIDLSLTTSNETSNPPYRTANFIWLRHLLGGLMFGVGMTLASGCGNKTLVRLGEGNMKSLVVLIIMGICAWWMLFTNLSYNGFLQWMLPLSIDFSLQDRGPTHGLIIALLAGLPLLFWILRAGDFRQNLELVSAGLVIGALIVIAWYVTAGGAGQTLMEELEFMDEPPFFTGAQSLTFIGPSGHIVQYLKESFGHHCGRRVRFVPLHAHLPQDQDRVVRVLERFLHARGWRRADGHRRRAGDGLHDRAGHFRGFHPGAGLDSDDPVDYRRQRRDDEIPVLPDDARGRLARPASSAAAAVYVSTPGGMSRVLFGIYRLPTKFVNLN
jgi:uncharacterized membrane protein YedE/YeeE